MLSFEEIKRNFPDIVNLENNSRNMIKEALQYKVLNIIYRKSTDLVFTGGSSLRIFHGIKRFSEDLDFDFVSKITYEITEHEVLLELICKELKKEGYDVNFTCKKTVNNVITGKLQFPGLEYKLKTTNNPNNVVNIKIEVQPQGYNYIPDKKLINKFGAFNTINIMPIDILFSAKLFTAIERKKGRDFYDIIELSSFTKANEGFLKFRAQKKGFKYVSPDDVKELIIKNLKDIDWKEKINEIGLFLFNKQDINKVELFPLWLEQTDFNTIVNRF